MWVNDITRITKYDNLSSTSCNAQPDEQEQTDCLYALRLKTLVLYFLIPIVQLINPRDETYSEIFLNTNVSDMSTKVLKLSLKNLMDLRKTNLVHTNLD